VLTRIRFRQQDRPGRADERRTPQPRARKPFGGIADRRPDDPDAAPPQSLRRIEDGRRVAPERPDECGLGELLAPRDPDVGAEIDDPVQRRAGSIDDARRR